MVYIFNCGEIPRKNKSTAIQNFYKARLLWRYTNLKYIIMKKFLKNDIVLDIISFIIVMLFCLLMIILTSLNY